MEIKLANSKQSKKRIIQSEKNRKHNVARSSMMRTFLKKTLYAIKEGNVDDAKTSFDKVVPILDRYATKGLIHKNKSARYKSRLNSKIKSIATQ